MKLVGSANAPARHGCGRPGQASVDLTVQGRVAWADPEGQGGPQLAAAGPLDQP